MTSTRFGWWRRRRSSRALAVGTLGCLVVFGVVLEAKRRRNLYWYDVAADYDFAFSGPASRAIPVDLHEWGFIMPDGAGTGGTAVLGVELRRRLSSRWFEPSIEVAAGAATSCPEYFERGAAGRRFLLMCWPPGSVAPGDSVRLFGRHLGWREQSATLHVFDAPDLARVLVLAPHADDAEIAAFGLYADHESWVVTLTTGGYGGDRYASLASSPAARHDLQIRLRVWDSLSSPRWAGIDPSRAINLGYPTTALEKMRSSPLLPVPDAWDGSIDIARWRSANVSDLLQGRPAIPSWANLVDDLAALLLRIGPTAVVAPHPALDANRDHVLTTAALLEALERTGAAPSNLLLYTNHHRWTEYYPFGPAYSDVPLPPWFDGSTAFESVHSHRLTSERVLQKLFALDQMHDLRPPPHAVTGGLGSSMAHRIREALVEIWRDPARELSYFRRAVRPNELFFVYRADKLETLRTHLISRQTAER